MADKKTVLSASTTTGVLTIGNYIGAVSNWAKMQDEYSCLYMAADLHSITVRQDPKELRQRSLSFIAQYLACGLDPEKNIIFMQSHVSEHTELAWVLSCLTPMGSLRRMTQFKDKSESDPKNINTGLFTYPVLMAADILLYQTNLVPVGEDQKQHLELTRDLAEQFNKRHGQAFVIPEPLINKLGARVMSLKDPMSKMSKSDCLPGAYVSVIDPENKIQKKIKSAVTDSGEEVTYDLEGKAGIANLMTIYSCLSGMSLPEIEKEFSGKLYGHFKVATADLVCDVLRPVREEYDKLIQDQTYLESMLKTNALRAKEIAHKTLKNVYKKTGFLTP